VTAVGTAVALAGVAVVVFVVFVAPTGSLVAVVSTGPTCLGYA